MEKTVEARINEGQTGEGQHEYAVQYLRRELATCIWKARSGNYDGDFLLDANEYTRLLVTRCPEPLQERADKLQHKVINRQVQIIVGAHSMRRIGSDYHPRPKAINVNEIAPKVRLSAWMIG